MEEITVKLLPAIESLKDVPEEQLQWEASGRIANLVGSVQQFTHIDQAIMNLLLQSLVNDM